MKTTLWISFIFTVINSVWCCVISKGNPFYKKPHIAALILARGGSKGIILKNLQKVANKTLLGRSLEQVLEVNFDTVWVSTDHPLIAEEAKKYNVNIHWRAPDTATDEASSLFATQKFLEHHPEIDVVALIQCTSPFISKRYLETAIKLIQIYKCVFSVSRSTKLIWKVIGKAIKAVNFDPTKRPRRQDVGTQLEENGMFYFALRRLIQDGYFQNNRCGFVEIPKYIDFEIDTPLDLVVANMLSELEL